MEYNYTFENEAGAQSGESHRILAMDYSTQDKAFDHNRISSVRDQTNLSSILQRKGVANNRMLSPLKNTVPLIKDDDSNDLDKAMTDAIKPNKTQKLVPIFKEYNPIKHKDYPRFLDQIQ